MRPPKCSASRVGPDDVGDFADETQPATGPTEMDRYRTLLALLAWTTPGCSSTTVVPDGFLDRPMSSFNETNVVEFCELALAHWRGLYDDPPVDCSPLMVQFAPTSIPIPYIDGRTEESEAMTVSSFLHACGTGTPGNCGDRTVRGQLAVIDEFFAEYCELEFAPVGDPPFNSVFADFHPRGADVFPGSIDNCTAATP